MLPCEQGTVMVAICLVVEQVSHAATPDGMTDNSKAHQTSSSTQEKLSR